MRTLLLFVVASLAILFAATTPPATKGTTGKKVTAKVTAAAKGRVPVRRKATSSSKAVPRTMAYHPISPSSDRYKEIQQSLISKGYLHGEPTGVWDQNSIDAMKKFQEDQKLDPTGKITSRALINLGLGPKDESGNTATTPTANK